MSKKNIKQTIVVKPGHIANKGHPVSRRAKMKVKIHHIDDETGEKCWRTLEGNVDTDFPATAATLLINILQQVLHEQPLRITSVTASLELLGYEFPTKPSPPEGPALAN